MYSPEIPDNLMHSLWILKRYCAEGPIASQLRGAIEDYLTKQAQKLGCPVDDVEEVIERHKKKEKTPAFRTEVIS